MLVGISGAQGQGKSTLINATVEKKPYLVEKADVQTARVLLNQWDYSLTEVNKYMPLKQKFQIELYQRHMEALNALAFKSDKDGKHILVERTFADIFVYALVSMGPFNEYSEWLNVYYNLCKDAQSDFLDKVVYLSGRTYVPEDDGVRSTNEHFSSMVDELIKKYTLDFDKDNTTEISVSGLDPRVFHLLGLMGI